MGTHFLCYGLNQMIGSTVKNIYKIITQYKLCFCFPCIESSSEKNEDTYTYRIEGTCYKPFHCKNNNSKNLRWRGKEKGKGEECSNLLILHGREYIKAV